MLGRGASVAALAVVGSALSLAAMANSDDPLLEALNHFKAEREAFDAYHADLDVRGKHLSQKEIYAHHDRCDVLIRAAVGLTAQAGSSLVVLDMLVDEMEIGQSIWSDEIGELVKAVRVYIVSTGRT